MDINTGNKISNKIIEAIETIVNKKVNAAKYNRIILAIVSEDTESASAPYTYKIQYQNSIFTAYGLDGADMYTKGTRVIVLIPNNDFSSKNKLVLGKAH